MKTTEQTDRAVTMTGFDQQAIIAKWIAATNSHDIDEYLEFYTDDASLDDPSVGEQFAGKTGIADYYRSYFIEYDTTTRVVDITPVGDHLHVAVDFTGTFPGGQTGGTFDVTFTGDKISFIRADLS